MADQKNIIMENIEKNGLPDIDKPEFRSLTEAEHLEDAMDRNEIESEEDTLEPQELGIDSGTVNVDDPKELAFWSEQFQVSADELRSIVALIGNQNWKTLQTGDASVMAISYGEKTNRLITVHNFSGLPASYSFTEKGQFVDLLSDRQID
jgi:hypothetical protein